MTMLFASNYRHYKTAAGHKRTSCNWSARSRPTTVRLWLEPLEDRRLPSIGLGWAFNVGGTGIPPGHSAGTAITTDTSGNVYVSGWFLSETVNFDPNNTNPNNPNNTLTNPNPGTSALEFVAKYTSNQTFQ